MQWRAAVGLVMAGGLLLSGCAFLRLDRDLKRQQAETFDGRVAVIRGQVAFDESSGAPAVVLCFAREEGRPVLKDYLVINHSSLYYFIVSAGEYAVAAFEDRNRNMRADPGEACGVYGAPEWLVVDRPGPHKGIDLVLEAGDPSAWGPLLTDLPLGEVSGRQYTSGVGVVTDLDNRLFAPEYAAKGLWEPYAFLKEVGYGLLFVEPYDPAKTPVLFVYGAAGQARNWRPIFEGIDRSRFQPWFFNYPTGMPLEHSAGALAGCLRQLHERFRFRHLFVVAHSMGGLVSRRALLRSLESGGTEYLALYVTISTPWGGHRAAEQGVARAPAVVPSWRDMVPDSDFIQAVFARPLPPSLPHELFFSFSGRSGLMRENNDGAVTLESQLDIRAQDAARRIRGFDQGHVGILFDPGVIQTLDAVLAARQEELDRGLGLQQVFEVFKPAPSAAAPVPASRPANH
jgi:pimeloyl-ACP methyl ester carboxylesterase